MTWQETIVTMLRNLIGDVAETSYTDARLQQIIVVTAQLVNGEVTFDTTYSIDVEAVTISPDPVANNDDLFTNLVTLKSACIIMRSELKSAASNEGVLIKDGMGSLEIKGRMKAFQDLANEFCKAYEKAKLEMLMGNFGTVRAIFNVATGPNINTFYDTYRGQYR